MAKTIPSPATVLPADRVTLVTETSPTPPGSRAPLNFALRADGTPAPFTLPKSKVLIVTDVIATVPRSNAAAGRYVAAIANTAGFHSRIPIEVLTAVDGFQKIVTVTGGVVFATPPEFQTVAGNPSDMSVWVYGYVAPRK